MPVQKIGFFVLAMLITGSIDSIRNLPATALFGTVLIFFCIFGAIVFLAPVALLSAELTSKFPEKGGVYHWSRMAFGEYFGFITVWLQWINTMVWYPTILSFIAGALAYLINPHLANNKYYLIAVILVVFWTLTLVNLKGLKISAKFAAVCAVVGMVIPMVLIIVMAIIWVCSGQVSQIHFSAHNLLPHLSHSQSWISLTAVMTAYLGMELATVHVRQVKNPQKNFPKALTFSVIFIVLTMVLGSLAIALVLPSSKISLVSGVVQAFSAFFAAYHLSWLLPVLVAMIVIGSLGGMINWIISPAKGLLQAAEHGFMPAWLSKENTHGAAGNVLFVQAILVSIICLAFLLMPSVNGSYWLLTDLSTQLYMLMYITMFIAAAVIKFKYSHVPSSFKVPGGKLGTVLVCLLGLFGVVVTLIVGFIPPANINVGSIWHYETLFIGGMVAMVLPVVLFFIYRKVCFKG